MKHLTCFPTLLVFGAQLFSVCASASSIDDLLELSTARAPRSLLSESLRVGSEVLQAIDSLKAGQELNSVTSELTEARDRFQQLQSELHELGSSLGKRSPSQEELLKEGQRIEKLIAEIEFQTQLAQVLSKGFRELSETALSSGNSEQAAEFFLLSQQASKLKGEAQSSSAAARRYLVLLSAHVSGSYDNTRPPLSLPEQRQLFSTVVSQEVARVERENSSSASALSRQPSVEREFPPIFSSEERAEAEAFYRERRQALRDRLDEPRQLSRVEFVAGVLIDVVETLRQENARLQDSQVQRLQQATELLHSPYEKVGWLTGETKDLVRQLWGEAPPREFGDDPRGITGLSGVQSEKENDSVDAVLNLLDSLSTNQQLVDGAAKLHLEKQLGVPPEQAAEALKKPRSLPTFRDDSPVLEPEPVETQGHVLP